MLSDAAANVVARHAILDDEGFHDAQSLSTHPATLTPARPAVEPQCRFAATRNHFTDAALVNGRLIMGVMSTETERTELTPHREPEWEAGTDRQLRGEIQLELFRSKLLMSRARELLDALMAVSRIRHN
jgi:hypothetical protein